MHEESITGLRNLRVLIVEDEPLVSMAIADELERCEATAVGPVSSVANAIDLLRFESVDAAILDIELRDMHVYPVADLLFTRGVPFIFSTATISDVIPERFAAVPTCAKPAPAREILRVLERCVRGDG